MTFIRENLPDPVSYFENRGQKIVGKRGKHFRTACPIHGGDGDTLSVLRNGGAFNCFSCGAKGGDLVAFEMQVNDVDFVTACKALGAWHDDGKPNAQHKPKPLPAGDALRLLAEESNLIAIAGGNIAHGVQLTDEDRARVYLAANRIATIQEAFQ